MSDMTLLTGRFVSSLHPMVACPSVCVSSLNGTIHVSILVFTFVCSFVNKQFDSVVLSHLPQRVLLLHA